MDRRGFLCCSGSTVVLGIASARGAEIAIKNVGEQLDAIRTEHGLPGISAAVARGKEVVAVGVAGVRRLDGDDKITPSDRFLVGSCTKRMTGLAVCRLIDNGRLTFETTLAEALPDFQIREDYRTVTIAQLLSFTGGIQPYTIMSPQRTPIIGQLKGTTTERREQLLRHVLQEEPVAKPGTERNYSNASYGLAAYIAARKAGQDFEDVLREYVFQPLRLESAGFGNPRTKEHPDQPSLHIKGANGYEPAPDGQTGPAEGLFLGAGGVHCTARDLVRFACYELAAAQGHDELLGATTAARWQALTADARTEGRPIFGGTQGLTAAFAIWPSKNLAAAVTINGGGAMEACRAFVRVAEME
jgi:CubicO group peptidase (beta-lactamase class C family)